MNWADSLWSSLKVFSRGQEEKSGTGLMHSDPKTSIFYLGHKELRAAVCMRSGLPLGDLDRWQNSCPETAFLKWGGGGWLGGTGVNMANSIRPQRQGFLLLSCARKKAVAAIHPRSVVWIQDYVGWIIWSVVTSGASQSAKCFMFGVYDTAKYLVSLLPAVLLMTVLSVSLKTSHKNR